MTSKLQESTAEAILEAPTHEITKEPLEVDVAAKSVEEEVVDEKLEAVTSQPQETAEKTGVEAPKQEEIIEELLEVAVAVKPVESIPEPITEKNKEKDTPEIETLVLEAPVVETFVIETSTIQEPVVVEHAIEEPVVKEIPVKNEDTKSPTVEAEPAADNNTAESFSFQTSAVTEKVEVTDDGAVEKTRQEHQTSESRQVSSDSSQTKEVITGDDGEIQVTSFKKSEATSSVSRVSEKKTTQIVSTSSDIESKILKEILDFDQGAKGKDDNPDASVQNLASEVQKPEGKEDFISHWGKVAPLVILFAGIFYSVISSAFE